MSRGPMAIVAVCMALAVAGCGDSDSSTSSTQASGESSAAGKSAATNTDLTKKPTIVVPPGPPPKQLEEKELVKGDGPAAKSGDGVTVQYVGVGYDSGEEFDTSWGRAPFSFLLGAGSVIKGWDQGVVGMKVGGRRELTIPAKLAYGPAGYPPAIGPNEPLIFVIDLLAIE